MSSPAGATQPRVKKPRYLWPVLVKIVLDVVVPTAGFYGLRTAGLSQVVSLCLTMLPAVVWFGYRLARGRRVDAFEAFILLIILSTDLTSFIENSPRLFLSTDGWTSVVLAAACLLSLRARRPLVYLLVRSLLDNTPLRVKHRTDDWDAMWRRDEFFHRPWRVSTVVWAGVNGVAAVVRLALAYFGPIDLDPILLGLVTLAIIVGLQIWQTRYLRGCFGATGAFVSIQPLPTAQNVAEDAAAPGDPFEGARTVPVS